jgi:cobalt-precorrin-5B (C1)-methyltransferase
MSKKKLRTGFTTGTAAAAAAKGSILCIIEKKTPEHVEIELLTGDPILIPIEQCVMEQPNTARCTVIKDAGDDPDITHGAEIGARVIVHEKSGGTNSVEITGGEGVGVVTKPGLEVPPGEPAINPGPRKMINQAILTVLNEHRRSAQVSVEIDVPRGGELAKKTLNERLGIIGGISILGTTGIVRPLSHESYTATIESALSVAEAMNNDRVVFTTGRRSERYSQNVWPDLPEEAFIQIGDYFEFSINAASRKKINSITIAAFFGKAVKMAQGIPCTHAAKSKLTLTRLADWASSEVNDSSLTEDILNANTARHAFDSIYGRHPELIAFVGKQVINSVKSFIKRKDVQIRSVIFDYEGKIAFDSDSDR